MNKHFIKKECDGMLLTMIIVFVLVTLTVTVGEFYRIHLLQQEIEYNLQRTVNCAVEYAMGDSYRQDKITNLNVAEAKQQFYQYLQKDVELDSQYRKHKNGKLSYQLHFVSVDGSSKPAVLTAKGTAEASSLFVFLTGGIKIPFEISSTNYRVD
ncbi:hypothetical protein INF28_09790 [Oscillospiraceae bacterium DSM 107454]|uniref:Uncharacterized protein n=1 Tax=Ructibacterium gallinarum TaxID=2779355 RepID=A0A9D5R9Q6_9FIRM|nr:hypothetical protein [Ructibacterium gallinarum]